MFRADDFPASLHTSDGSGICDASQSRNTHVEIPRRLVDSGLIEGILHLGKGSSDASVLRAGHHSESDEVAVRPDSDCDLFRHGHQCLDFEGFSHGEEGFDPRVSC